MSNGLEVQYGAGGGVCLYKDRTFSGSHRVTITRNEMGTVEVDHVWNGLSNGKVSVDGLAHVTWNLSNKTRRVVHETTWTREADGRRAVGSGDRRQSLLDGQRAEGIQVDGERSWKGESGAWHLSIDGVQMRWVDPVPQAGTYVLDTPFGGSLELAFVREDHDTIAVTASSGRRDFTFRVNALGIR